jgi:hypothetical protein
MASGEYIELAITERREEVVLQLRVWAWGLKHLTTKKLVKKYSKYLGSE